MKKLVLVLALVGLLGCSVDDGKDGTNGLPGRDGNDGAPGEGCSVEQTTGGAVITCADGSMSVILHGSDGLDAVVEKIKPCAGTGSREVLLRLSDGSLLAHYSDGANQFLAELFPGTWRLTDGSSCVFTVHHDLSVTW